MALSGPQRAVTARTGYPGLYPSETGPPAGLRRRGGAEVAVVNWPHRITAAGDLVHTTGSAPAAHSWMGYEAFSEQPVRARGPHVRRSVYTGTVHVSYGGSARRQGYVETPRYDRNSPLAPVIHRLIEVVSDAKNTLRLPLPSVDGGVARRLVVVQPTRIRPPERDNEGIWRGWRIDWIEVMPTAVTAPVALLPTPAVEEDGRASTSTGGGLTRFEVDRVELSNWVEAYEPWWAVKFNADKALATVAPTREGTRIEGATILRKAIAAGPRAARTWSFVLANANPYRGQHYGVWVYYTSAGGSISELAFVRDSRSSPLP